MQRRGSREAVDEGGWSTLHSYGTVAGYSNPAVNPLLRGSGLDGWFGWWNSPSAEALVQQWLETPDPDVRRQVGRALGSLALAEVAIVPLGQWFGQTAFGAASRAYCPAGRPIHGMSDRPELPQPKRALAPVRHLQGCPRRQRQRDRRAAYWRRTP